tara:strand:- start:1174 stop:1401 length:228 start_codon:yes stop_codon:yes gene_type:complete
MDENVLTEMEQYVFGCVTEGMDTPGTGWLIHICDDRYTAHQYAGIIGSLVKKGLITSQVMEEDGGEVWLELVDRD